MIVASAMLALLLATGGFGQETAARSATERYAGVYEVEPDRLIFVQPWPGGSEKLAYTDENGLLRELFPAGVNRFEGGPGLRLRAPAEIRILFEENDTGEVRGLLREKGRQETRARKLPGYGRDHVSFRSGGETLGGLLLTPPGPGPHPAMVLLHGSGQTDRYTVLPITQYLLAHGMALLAFDKRGVGQSTGDWQRASLQELADDAVAAMQWLKTRGEIDARRVGVLGASQGGWVGPLAAESGEAAFVVSISGPAVSPAEVDADRLRNELPLRGSSKEEIDAALRLSALRAAVAAGREKPEAFLQAVAEAEGAHWLRQMSVPGGPDSWLFEHWRRLPLDYDPQPAITELRVPVLALFGALDRNVDPLKNAEKWKAALERGGVEDFTVHVFPKGNHMLLEAETGAQEEYAVLQRFVPGYGPLLLEWLRERGLIGK